MMTVHPRTSIESLLLAREIEEFLYHEADLLDERRYEEWLELLTDDVRYWMPMARNVQFGDERREWTQELRELAWLDESKTTLTQRVQQIMTGIHWAEEPASRVIHMVTNVHLPDGMPPSDRPQEVKVKCRFLVYRNRLQAETDFLIGRRIDVLRSVDGGWKIARREIYLEQNVLLAKNLTMFF